MQQGQHRSIWLATAEVADYAPLAGDVEVDVAIVGAGITGLTAAALLAPHGVRVAVLEKETVGCGVTGHTTGHLDVTTDNGLARLIKLFGETGARLVVESSRLAIEQLGKLADGFGLDCDFRRVPSWVFSEEEADGKWLEDELEAAHQLGVKAELSTTSPLPFPVKAALRVDGQGRLHAGKYITGLAAAIAGENCRIYTHTPVRQVEDGEPCRIHTDRGVVTAREVILATHSPSGLHLAMHTRLEPWRSYVIAARLAGPLGEDIYWDTATPYHYIRRFDDADPALALVGGADHHTGAAERPEDSYEQLEQWTRERFAVEAIEYRWSAQVFVSVDGLPFIGRLPGASHVHVGSGYAGTGITFGTYAGMLLSDLLLGRDNPAAELYDPARVNALAAARKFAGMNISAAAHFVRDKLDRGEDQALETLAAGEGRLIKVDGHKRAAYRDEAGRLHLLSPICPHAKCHVVWNSAEKCWDCPCHGSIFHPTGEVMSGPVMHGLERIE